MLTTRRVCPKRLPIDDGAVGGLINVGGAAGLLDAGWALDDGAAELEAPGRCRSISAATAVISSEGALERPRAMGKTRQSERIATRVTQIGGKITGENIADDSTLLTARLMTTSVVIFW